MSEFQEMSEFNELVKAFLLGNNLRFEENEKEPNILILSDIIKGNHFMAKLFHKVNPQKESLKILIIDGKDAEIELNDEADIVIWNDSFSGWDLKNKKSLEERIKSKILDVQEKNNKKQNKLKIEDKLVEYDSRYLGMAKNLLFSKFFGENRKKDLLEVGKLNIKYKQEKKFFSDEELGIKRFGFIIEERPETEYLKREFNRFMEFFCNEDGVMAQSLPVYFTSMDFWFGGMIHTQLTKSLNQDLGLFFTEDTVFYMTKLGFIVPFIDEMDLYCTESYLNPQDPRVAHLFQLCGERGMFVAGCSRDSLLYEDVGEGLDSLSIPDDQWKKMIVKPMGSRIIEDEVNAKMFGPKTKEEENEERVKIEELLKLNEENLIKWKNNPDFPILKPVDRSEILKQVAQKWMEKGSYLLELDDFRNILFECGILREGTRTLSHIHEIIRAIMNSNILMMSDFNYLIPVSRLMGEAIILWMLREEYAEKKSLDHLLDKVIFNQRICRRLLSGLESDGKKNALTSLYIESLDWIQKAGASERIIENAFGLHIAIVNNPGRLNIEIQAIRSSYLNDKKMSHKILKNLKFVETQMPNILFQQSIFINCTFFDCDLTSAYFAGSTFLNCLFEKNKFNNVDFSGSYFDRCKFKENEYENAILIGCFFKDTCELESNMMSQKIWAEGSSIVGGEEEKYDLPLLIHLLQKRFKFYTRYGFKINPDVTLEHYGYKNKAGEVQDERFFERYNYIDFYDEITGEPELFFVKTDSIHYISKEMKKNYKDLREKGIKIDHVIKYKEKNENKVETTKIKILFHTPTRMFIKSNLDGNDWFKDTQDISDRFVGKGISAIFLNPGKIVVATDWGGLFLFEKNENDWTAIDNKFQSEPVSQIFTDRFKDFVFMKRGKSVVEIWDTLNDLSLWGSLVTSFKEVFAIHLIGNLNHAIIYGEWADNSIGALAYNIINKHLITYWDIVSSEDTKKLEESYKKKLDQFFLELKERSSRQVSLDKGFIQKGCSELRTIIDSLKVTPPEHLTWMEGEPIEFIWKIESNTPHELPITKNYTDLLSGKKVEFDFEIKIGDLPDFKSGKLKGKSTNECLSVIWEENKLEIQKENFWGNHNLLFKVSLLGEEIVKESIFRIRPKNPFKGGVALSREKRTSHMFVGREKELATACTFLGKKDSFSIMGARRIGKTSFIHRLRENFQPHDFLAAYISLDTSEYTSKESESGFITKTKQNLKKLEKKYPDIFNEFWPDAKYLQVEDFSLSFRWIVIQGLKSLKEKYPLYLEKIWPELEIQMNEGISGGTIYETFLGL
ncbi:MAG: pentapeptide repeat-containing protein [Candidatus Omnitrophota bacterium]